MAPPSSPAPLAAAAQIWSRLSGSQRWVLVVAALASIGSVMALVWLANRTSYQTLYAGLGPEDAAAVVERLKELKTEYRLTDGGSSIEVPQEKLDELRLSLAASGLPGSGKLGFEIFDRNQLGMTSFTENVNLRRALEGELARSVRTLSEVAAARFHVVVPSERGFGLKRESAKASVVLRLRPGRTLEPHNVEAIRQLVASAVKDLDAQSVVVVDDGGTLLSGTGPGLDPGHMSRAELDEIRSFEEDLSTKVLAMLEPLYGPGRVSARVSADLDFSDVEETAELVDPQQTAVVSEQLLRETPLAADAAGSGVPGVASNVSGRTATATGATTLPRSRTSESRNYEVSRTVRRVRGPGWSLERLSVAVAADSRALEGVDGASADVERVSRLVEAAVGIDSARGDQVRVEFLPFGPEQAPAQASTETESGMADHVAVATDLLRRHGRQAGLVLLALAVYLFFLRPIKRQALSALRSAGELPAAGETTGGEVAGSAARRLLERGEAAPAAAREAGVVPAQMNRSLVETASSDPAGTARYIRALIGDEEA